MAGGKPMRRIGGRTLLERALQWARCRSCDVALSARDLDQFPRREDVPVLIDDPAIPGPLAGVASALRFAKTCGAAAVLTIPCDAPFLPDELGDRLNAALAEGKGVAMAGSSGRMHPVCALWRAGLDEAVAAYARTGRGSLMGLAEAVGWTAAEWTDQPVDPFFNINTPDDLAKAEALLAAG